MRIFRFLVFTLALQSFLACDSCIQEKPVANQKTLQALAKVKELTYKNPDSALWYLSRAKQWSVENNDIPNWLEANLSLTKHYLSRRDSLGMDSLLKTIKREDLQKKLTEALLTFGRANQDFLIGNYDRVLYRLDSLEILLEHHDSNRFRFSFYYLMGNTLRSKNDSKGALEAYQKSYEYQQTLKNENRLKGITLFAIGSIFTEIQEYEKAIALSQEALPLLKDQPLIRFHWNLNLTSCHLSLKNFKEAKRYLDLCEQNTIALKNPAYKNRFLSILGSYYSTIGRYEKSIVSYLAAYELSKKHPGLSSVPYTANGLSKSYFLLEKYDLAEKYARIAMSSAKKTGAVYRVMDAHGNLSKVDSARGNYKSALSHYQKSSLLKDSMNLINRNEEISRLKMEFDQQKKDSEMTALKLKNSQQKLLTNKNRFSRALILFFLAGALGISGILFMRYRAKAKTTQVLQEKETVLKKALQEKELLLKEIHHRVKNNLQLIMSLLAIQGLSQEKESKVIKAFLQKGESRIRSMALIHQILYETDGVQHVNFKNYLQRLIAAIKNSYPSGTSEITYKMQVSDIHFDLEQALSLGLITHEVIMNAIKHAFPDGQKGEIEITLHKNGQDILLGIKDNGVGIAVKNKKPGAIGMELVELLTEQLKGTMKLVRNRGTQFSISLSVL